MTTIQSVGIYETEARKKCGVEIIPQDYKYINSPSLDRWGTQQEENHSLVAQASRTYIYKYVDVYKDICTGHARQRRFFLVSKLLRYYCTTNTMLVICLVQGITYDPIGRLLWWERAQQHCTATQKYSAMYHAEHLSISTCRVFPCVVRSSSTSPVRTSAARVAYSRVNDATKSPLAFDMFSPSKLPPPPAPHRYSPMDHAKT